MKILFIIYNFVLEVNAPATRTYEHVKEWIKNKYVEVTLHFFTTWAVYGCNNLAIDFNKKLLANKILSIQKSIK